MCRNTIVPLHTTQQKNHAVVPGWLRTSRQQYSTSPIKLDQTYKHDNHNKSSYHGVDSKGFYHWHELRRHCMYDFTCTREHNIILIIKEFADILITDITAMAPHTLYPLYGFIPSSNNELTLYNILCEV